MAKAWYALRTKPHKEQFVQRQAEGLSVEAYYPYLRANPVNPRAASVKPYFPGYLFVRADLEFMSINTFQFMPHATGLVCFGGEPGVVPPAVIETLRQELIAMNASGRDPIRFQRGDRLVIRAGLLEGYQAIFDTRLSGHDRVRVLLDLMSGRSVSVELSAYQLGSATQKLAA